MSFRPPSAVTVPFTVIARQAFVGSAISPGALSVGAAAGAGAAEGRGEGAFSGRADALAACVGEASCFPQPQASAAITTALRPLKRVTAASAETARAAARAEASRSFDLRLPRRRRSPE